MLIEVSIAPRLPRPLVVDYVDLEETGMEMLVGFGMHKTRIPKHAASDVCMNISVTRNPEPQTSTKNNASKLCITNCIITQYACSEADHHPSFYLSVHE